MARVSFDIFSSRIRKETFKKTESWENQHIGIQRFDDETKKSLKNQVILLGGIVRFDVCLKKPWGNQKNYSQKNLGFDVTESRENQVTGKLSFDEP